MGNTVTIVKNKKDRHYRDKSKVKEFKKNTDERVKKKSAIEELWRRSRNGPKDTRKRTKFKNFFMGDPEEKTKGMERPVSYATKEDEDRRAQKERKQSKEDNKTFKDGGKRRKSSLGSIIAKHTNV